MNLVNLFGQKTKAPEPEYFLAVEIHESLIKSVLWEILLGQPEVVNLGSYESWTDEESLINGVDSSLDQAVKVINTQPKRTIFGLPDSWMEDEKIHPTKTKLITHLCKELGLEPIGVVTTNRAISHYLKKREGMPPTVILLEVYTSKVAVSYVYLGEVKKMEEVARSGDLAHDVEEGLARMDLTNYPARFILTNGSSLEDESQQITSFPWTDRLPFKHIPKVEVLPIDFSIKSIALTGGIEAVQFLGVEVKEDDFVVKTTNPDSNLVVPVEEPPAIEELGFTYEETEAPSTIPVAEVDYEPKPEVIDEIDSDLPVYPIEESPKKKSFNIKLPSFPKFTFPSLHRPSRPLILLAIIPIVFAAICIAYFFLGQAVITIHFTPQKISRQVSLVISDAQIGDQPTLIATKKSFSGTSTESIPTSGTATVGEKATGTITIANKSLTPITLKPGSTIANETGKYIFTITSAITVASASSDPIDPVSGKAVGVQVAANRIGAEYNLTKGTIFTVDNYSKSIAAAIAEGDFTGGTSRTVNAVSKQDQEKLLSLAVEKVKSQIKSDSEIQTPGYKVLPLSDIQFTKKQFDHNLNEEATSVSLSIDGSLNALVYSDESLHSLVVEKIKDQIPPGSETSQENTKIILTNLTKTDDRYQATANIEASLYPRIDEAKLASYIRGKSVNNIRHFFEPISGFTSASVKISPAIPLITKILPWKNIKFQLLGN